MTMDPIGVGVGSIVLYRSYGTRDGRHAPAHLPMMVVEVHQEEHDWRVSGWVYYVDGLRYHDRVPFSRDEAERATWFSFGGHL